MKLFEKIKVNKEREISVLGVPIIQYGRKLARNYEEKYFKILPKSFEQKALDKILKFIPKDANHDHIFVIRTTGLGEAHLLNYAISGLKKKWGFKNPCIVSQRHIYKDMYSLYTDIPFYPLEIRHNDYAPFIKHRNIKYKGKYFHILHCTIYESMTWLKAHQNGDVSHLLEAIEKWWGIENFNDNEMNFSQDLIDSTLEKVKSIGLNLDNFVFIAPESNGTTELPEEFWIELTNKLKDKGYDIFVNTLKPTTSYGKCIKLSVSEAMYLATLAKNIVTLRCGFAEILSAIKRQHTLYTLYTPFRQIQPDSFIKTYTLSKYPFSTKGPLEEIIVNNNEQEVIEKLVSKL